MSLGLCVLVGVRQDSICVRFASAGLFCAGPSRVESFVPDRRTGRMLPGAQDFVLSASFGFPFDHEYCEAGQRYAQGLPHSSI